MATKNIVPRANNEGQIGTSSKKWEQINAGTVYGDAVIVRDGAGNFLQMPKLTTGQRDALTPVNGMILYNSTTNEINVYENGSWITISVSGHTHDDRYYTGAEIDATLAGYYTEAEVDSAIAADISQLKKLYTYVVGPSGSGADYIYNGTDIGVALNASITALLASGNDYGSIYVMPGIYTLTTQLVFRNKSNISLIGSGIENTRFVANGFTTPLLDMVSTTGPYRYKQIIKGFTLDNTTPAAGSIGVRFGLNSDMLVEDVLVKNCETGFALTDGMFYNRFRRLMTQDCTKCVTLTAGSTDKPNSNQFAQCKFLDADSILELNDGNQNTFFQCEFENFDTRAIYVDDIGNAFIGNRIESNNETGDSVYVELTVNAKNNQFQGNYYSGNDWGSLATAIIDNGAGNSFYEVATFRNQFIRADRNLLTAENFIDYKRTGAGGTTDMVSLRDLYTPSGTPTTLMLEAARAGAKFLRGVRSAVEYFYITAAGKAFFKGVDAGSQKVENVLDPTVAQDAATKNYIDSSDFAKKEICIVPFESDSDIQVGDGKIAFTVPSSMNNFLLVDACASVFQKGVTGTTDIQIRRRRAGTNADMLTTKITIGDEFFASDGLINSANDDLLEGDQIYIDIDSVHTTRAKGLSVSLVFQK